MLCLSVGVRPDKPTLWLCTSYILSFFGSAKNYVEFIAEGVDTELSNFYNFSKLPSILVSQKFISKNINILNDGYKIETSPDINRTTKLFTIDKICHLVAIYFDIEIVSLKKVLKNNYPRMLAIFLVRNLTQLTHQKISEYFSGIKKSSISTTVIKCKNLIDSDIYKATLSQFNAKPT
jgi:chromosomal replication initiation ATPase DnaA